MQIDWWTLAIQTINFLVVVWLLSRFLYRPVRRMIETREASDRAAAEDARRKAEEADKLRGEYERRLSEFEEQMRRRETELHTTMQREQDDMLTAAREQAEALLVDARSKIETERKRALSELHEDIVALARDLAARSLSGASADPVTCLKAELARQDADGLSTMKQDLAAGGRVTVITASNLTEQMRGELQTALAETFGDGVSVFFETDAELLGGVVLRLPHGLLDASVGARLSAAAEKMMEGEDDA